MNKVEMGLSIWTPSISTKYQRRNFGRGSDMKVFAELLLVAIIGYLRRRSKSG